MAKKAGGSGGFIKEFFQTILGTYRSPNSFDVALLIWRNQREFDRVERSLDEYLAGDPNLAARKRIVEEMEILCDEHDATEDQTRKDEYSRLIEELLNEYREIPSKRRWRRH